MESQILPDAIGVPPSCSNFCADLLVSYCQSYTPTAISQSTSVQVQWEQSYMLVSF